MKKRKHFFVVPASYIFFRDGEKVLLSVRKNSGYFDGHYSLPAGHIEEGGYALATAIREAKEEVGVDILPQDLSIAHVMYRMKADHVQADYFFEVKKWSGKLLNAEPEKCDGISWHSVNDLPENTIPYIRAAINLYTAGQVYSEYDETGKV